MATSFDKVINLARKFGGDNSLYNDTSTARRGAFANHPAHIPKYNTNNNLAATDTAARFYFPNAKDLLRTNSADKDILQAFVGNGYIDFIATSVQMSYSERIQIRKLVNGAYSTYFFGTEPPTVNISGFLLNDFQNDWMVNFLRLYINYIRGSKLARRRRLAYFAYDSYLIGGIPFTTTNSLTGDNETTGQFSLQLLISTLQVKKNPISTATVPAGNFPFDKIDSPSIPSKKKTSGGIRTENDQISKKQLEPKERLDRLAHLSRTLALKESDLAGVKLQLANAGGVAGFTAATALSDAQIARLREEQQRLEREIAQISSEMKALKSNNELKNTNVKGRSSSRINITTNPPAARSR